MSYSEHKELSADNPTTVAIVTVSDSRTEDTDSSGKLIQERLLAAGHSVVRKIIVRDEPEEIRDALRSGSSDCDVIIFNGGTGFSKRDSTFEVVSGKLQKTLPGFGELFRMLSFEEIGPGAMLSRATAGVFEDTIIFSLPGSTNAVSLAMDKLIVSELSHLVWEILRK